MTDEWTAQGHSSTIGADVRPHGWMTNRDGLLTVDRRHAACLWLV